jgi:glycerophosphoryl diester phosphodiesterase
VHNDSFLFTGLVQGEYVDTSDGSVKTMSSYERTDYLDVSNMGVLHVTAPAALSFCALYDSEKKFIKNIVFGASEAEYELPNNAVYLMMSAGKGLLADTIVKNKLWTVANKEVPVVAKESAYNKRGKETIDAAFTIGTMMDGVIDASVIYRVTTRDIVSYDRDVTLCINDNDHQFGVAFYNNGEFESQTGWIQKGGEKFVPANKQFRVVVSPITAAWAKADIEKLSSMMEIDTVLADKFTTLKRDAVKRSLFAVKSPRFVAHRGMSGVAPENTIAAFEEAGKAGAYAIETDVYVTSDGHFVLSHDNDISAYTNAPIGTNITEHTLNEVQRYNVTKGANVSQYAGQKIPTLNEYLEICVLYGCVPIIEIKNIRGLFNELVAVVNAYGFYGDAVYTNYKVYYDAIRKAVGDCVVTVNLDGTTSYTEQIESLKDAGAYNVIVAMSPAIANVDAALVKKCHEYGYLVNVWTINDAETAKQYFRMGVDMVTSDFLAYRKW